MYLPTNSVVRVETRDVAARPGQASDEPVCYRISDSTENNGNGCRRSLGGEGGE
jgi:hypothetical protein